MSGIWNTISTEGELDDLLSGSSVLDTDCFVLLKHSSRCAISSVAKARLERKVDPRLTYFLIDVIRNREVSDQLAEITGLRHESPQLFLFQQSQLIDVKSHMAISPNEVSRRLNAVIQIEI